MEGEFGAILWQVILGSVILFGANLIPALAIVRILDPSADRIRQGMLIPACSLLVTFGVVGWSIVLLGGFERWAIALALIGTNALGLVELKREEVSERRLTHWEKLQQMIEADEVEAEEEELEKGEEEDAEEKTREWWLPFGITATCLLGLLPLFIFEYPNGVDWIGFATLSNRLATVGEFTLPAISSGSWTYPPAFPGVSALLQGIGMTPADSIHLLGQLSLIALVLGIAGAADRWNASGVTLLALALGPALFVKAHDSGYPTVASQLGLVIGLLVLVRPLRHRTARQDVMFVSCLLLSAVIHPTGSIYLSTLLIAYAILHRYGAKSSIEVGRLTMSATLAVAVGVYFALAYFAPRLLAEPVFSEYGWQGGISLLLFNGPLLVIAGLFAAWWGRASMEIMLVTIWLGLNWSLSLVHLLDGIVTFSSFALLSYVLYSMALHAFHVPLAVLAGLAFSSEARLTPRLRPIPITDEGEDMVSSQIEEEREGEDEVEFEAGLLRMELPTRINDRWMQAMFVVVILQLAFANSLLVELSSHEEMWVQTEGDRTLMRTLDLPPGSVIFTEDAHWGNPYDLDPDIGITTFPSLGLVDVEDSKQGRVKHAILKDDVNSLIHLGITHALTSPLGKFGSVLAESDYWTLIKDEEGSRLWEFTENPDQMSSLTSTFSYPSSDDCNDGCEWRKDPWWMIDADQLENRPSSQPFLTEGTLEMETETPRQALDGMVRINLMIDSPEGLDVELIATDGDEMQVEKVVTEGGWQQISLILKTSLNGTISTMVEVEGGGKNWVNPLWITGRGDRLIDEYGVRIHWVEVRPMVA